jgi:Rps23 Pro-64 3,4-dihydroxylase Tpa1-like proline 4-hydroxylase
MEFYSYPVPFCIVKNFLSERNHEQVKKELNRIKPYLKGPEMTGASRINGEPTVKRKGLFLHEHEYLKGNTAISSIYDKVIDPDFVNQLASKNWVFQYLDNEHTPTTLISLYEDGDEYKYHKDKAVMSIIYYLFEGEFEGGEFYLNQVKIPIENNSIIIFPSCVDHCVYPIKGKGSRWSITTFFNLKSGITNMPADIHRFQNFLNPGEWKQTLDIVNSSRNWSLSGYSNGDPNINKFWNLDLNNNEFFTRYLFDKIPNGPWRLLRVYANGQTTGQNGDFHQDSTNSTDWTFMFYANDINLQFLTQWGGETEFITENGNMLIKPEPNSGVLFKSSIQHRGLAPSRHVNALRVTIAWKLTKA